MEYHNDDSIDLKGLFKKVLRISRNRKRSFTILFGVLMLLSGAYFTKVILKPTAKGREVLAWVVYKTKDIEIPRIVKINS